MSVVLGDECECRALNVLLDTESRRNSLRERRFAGAKVTVQEHHIAPPQEPADPCADLPRIVD